MQRYCTTSEFFVEVASGNTTMPAMHYHKAYELYYLEVGSREYFIEDKLFQVNAGDFVLIPPGKLHRTGGAYGKRILLQFTDTQLCKFYTREAADQLLKCFAHWKITPTHLQQKRCIELLKQMTTDCEPLEAILLLGQLLAELGKCATEEIQEDGISKIVAFINANYAQIDTIADIAKHFFISKYHLCRIFKNAMKVTVIEYLNQIRIKNACQFLSFSDNDIGEIAEQCGFHSIAYFSNVFKKITGQSPSEFRRENYEKSDEKGV